MFRFIRAALRPLSLAPLVIGCTLLLGLAGCDGKKQQAPPPPPVSVAVVKAERKAAPLVISGVGHVDATRTVNVRSQVTGTLLKTNFTEGTQVKEGDLLFGIDAAPFQARLRQAEAARGKSKAALDQNARDYTRYSDLVKKEVVSRDDYEKTMTAKDQSNMQVRQDEADIATARLNLGYTAIRSPVAGIAGLQKIKTGNLVNANTEVLISIAQIQPVIVKFSLPERQLPLLRRYLGQEPLLAWAKVPGNPDFNEQGRVTAVDNNVDPLTGMVLVQAEFPNASLSLWPGQYVTVNVVLTVDQDALIIPSRAIIPRREGKFIFVVGANSTVDLRQIETAREMDTDTVVQSGLAPGENVVVDGIVRLRPGGQVQIREPQAPAQPDQAKDKGGPGA